MTADKRYRDGEWLRGQYLERERSGPEIAELCDVSRSTIFKWLRKHNIETRAGGGVSLNSPLRDADWLREQYVEKQKSTLEMAELCDVDKKTVLRWLEKTDIDRRKPGEANKRRKPGEANKIHNQPTEKWLRQQYFEEGKSMSKIGELCGVSRKTVSRWFDRYDIQYSGKVKLPQDSPLRDADWLREQYVEKQKSTIEIAELCGRAHDTVCRWLEKAGIETRDQRGENSPRWNGGPVKYGAGWNERKRRRVRERDGYECVRCGATQEEHKARYGERLHVHHLTKARDIDNAEERNSMSNLVALCRDCHADWERVSAAGLRPQITTAGD